MFGAETRNYSKRFKTVVYFRLPSLFKHLESGEKAKKKRETILKVIEGGNFEKLLESERLKIDR
jgi:hypothetical protein